MSIAENRLGLNSSVIKSFIIIEYLARAHAPKELGVISNDLGLNKSTAYRFLSTLMRLGYVSHEEGTGKYSLGPKVVWLASRFLENLDLRTLARPLLNQLVDETGETVHLAVLDNYEVVYIEKIDGRQPVQMRSRVGNRLPAHSTGLGKALLAGLDHVAWAEYVETIGLKMYTKNTITEPGNFYQEMRDIQRRGYSIDDCENEDGVRCIAVPIRDHTGKTVAAISVSGWMLSMTLDRSVRLAPVVLSVSKRISEKLGVLDRVDRSSY